MHKEREGPSNLVEVNVAYYETRAFMLIARHNWTLAYAFVGQALADGDYELVLAQEREGAEGELNAVRAEPSAEQVASDSAANPESEGKPRSMTYLQIMQLCS